MRGDAMQIAVRGEAVGQDRDGTGQFVQMAAASQVRHEAHGRAGIVMKVVMKEKDKVGKLTEKGRKKYWQGKK